MRSPRLGPDRDAVRMLIPSAVYSRSRSDLRREGLSPGMIAALVRAGAVVRARNGVYLDPQDDARVREAATLGGRLTCVSELQRRGVFVLDRPNTHVHLPANASRHRRPPEGVRRHWGGLLRRPHPRSCTVEAIDAVRHAILCQEPRASVATIDSALRCGVLRRDDLPELFASLPRRYRVLSRLVDERAESGPESLVRLILRRLGVRFDVQVKIRGVGRVDFLVEGWLIIECDSEEFHGGWEARRRDLRRDQAAAAMGYTTYRPIAEDIFWNQHLVVDALRGLLGRRRHTG